MLYKYMFPNDELLHIHVYVRTKEKKKASFPFNPETEKWGNTILLPTKSQTITYCQCCN